VSVLIGLLINTPDLHMHASYSTQGKETNVQKEALWDKPYGDVVCEDHELDIKGPLLVALLVVRLPCASCIS
jgi:hypothetical protein